MNILFLTQNFSPTVGGSELFQANLCLELTRLGHQVEVLALLKEVREETAEFDRQQPYFIHRYEPKSGLSSRVPILHTWRHARRFAPDVLFLGHVMSTHGLGAVLVKRLLGVPYVVLCHGGELVIPNQNWADVWGMSMLLRNANLVLANSRYTSQCLENVGVDRQSIRLLHPGVDTERFTPDVPGDEIELVRERYQLGDMSVILTVARLVYRKNHAAVLRALPNVVRQIGDVCYLVVGDGPERSALVQLVDELKLGEHVVLAGQVPDSDLPAIYAASELFVMPSLSTEDDFEGFGIVFAEAGACGLPVIGGRSGGIEDVVVDGETGLLVDPLNVDQIAGAIIRLLADKAYARQLGENGRKRVVRELRWEQVIARLEGHLFSVVERRCKDGENAIHCR